MNFSIPANPLALDLNNDGYIDRVYIGDVGGQMWKFDLSNRRLPLTGGTSGTVNNWTGKRFFRAGSDTNPPAAGEYYPTQAIYGAANAALDANRALWIYFGTGDRNHPNNAAANRFYGIKDATTMTNGSTYTEATSGMVDATTADRRPYSRLVLPAVQHRQGEGPGQRRHLQQDRLLHLVQTVRHYLGRVR